MDRIRIACLIPYRWDDNVIRVFLQRRTVDAKTNPDRYGFWGGGIEDGETHEQTVVREVREELTYKLEGHYFFGAYSLSTEDKVPGGKVKYVYAKKVEKNFESLIKIEEGQSDKCRWFDEWETMNDPLVTIADKTILKVFFGMLKNS